jgi:hypothetical protein
MSSYFESLVVSQGELENEIESLNILIDELKVELAKGGYDRDTIDVEDEIQDAQYDLDIACNDIREVMEVIRMESGEG